MTLFNAGMKEEIHLIQVSSFIVLPKSHYMQFDCGVKVQLGFAAEFSNIMVIYTRILEKPKEIVSCCAQLTDFPEVCRLSLHMKTNMFVLACNDSSCLWSGILQCFIINLLLWILVHCILCYFGRLWTLI